MTKQLIDETNPANPTPQQAAANGDSPPSSPARPVRSEVQIDDSGAVVCYANFCRVTGTPEELILDFGLNPQPTGATMRVEVKQRLVVNYFTAKRLLQALGMSIQRHERAFGVLETDVQKRVTPAARRGAAAG